MKVVDTRGDFLLSLIKLSVAQLTPLSPRHRQRNADIQHVQQTPNPTQSLLFPHPFLHHQNEICIGSTRTRACVGRRRKRPCIDLNCANQLACSSMTQIHALSDDQLTVLSSARKCVRTHVCTAVRYTTHKARDFNRFTA